MPEEDTSLDTNLAHDAVGQGRGVAVRGSRLLDFGDRLPHHKERIWRGV